VTYRREQPVELSPDVRISLLTEFPYGTRVFRSAILTLRSHAEAAQWTYVLRTWHASEDGLLAASVARLRLLSNDRISRLH